MNKAEASRDSRQLAHPRSDTARARRSCGRLAATSAIAALALAALPNTASAAQYRLVGWNNLGMHCMDAEFSVLSLLPPYNTIHAQLIDPQGKLVRTPGSITVTYEATADPTGSFNSTSQGKTDFWQYVSGLFGVSLAPDQGLAGKDMPGPANIPQPMTFDPANAWFIGEGVPITPYDDAGAKNPYPMMKLVARDGAGTVLATTRIVLPVSDEMSCALCHAAGTSEKAKPAAGWITDPDPQREFRLNTLALHDDLEGSNPRFQQALAEVGYNPAGLLATATKDHRAVLCAGCHLSEALPGSGLAGIEPLTEAVHSRMAGSIDPRTGLTLDSTDNRTACYTCHPGSATRCLRGAMGAAVAADGSLAMQCQSCHGGMTDVGSPLRTGWLQEPRCDSCHTGTAMHNNGAIRFTSVFEADGSTRNAVDTTFATNNDTPAAGLSLYRFSSGHGGLQCSACHGSTHAVFPSSHENDNVQSIALQGHKGVLADCNTCHATVPQTVSGGPHGMHPIGAQWVSAHGDAAEDGHAGACRTCHGADYRGTVLSRSQGDRVFTTKFGTKSFWRGSQIGCYACHQGPSSESANPNHPAVVQNASATTTADRAVSIPLQAADADGNPLALRVVSQPQFGTTGLQGRKAVYYPDGSHTGSDSFTFAAWDGSIDSNLGTVNLTVGAAPCPIQCQTAAGCDENCVQGIHHDAFLSQPSPVNVAIGTLGTTVRKTLKVTVTDLDPAASDAQTIRVQALDGTCPSGTVQGVPAFTVIGADGPGSVDLGPGLSAVAKISLRFVADDYVSLTRRAPTRCALLLRAVPASGTDPTPVNNDVYVEVNVRDLSDTFDAAAVDGFLTSVIPVKVQIAKSVLEVSQVASLRVNLDAPAGMAAVALHVAAEDGTCPPGTVGEADLNTRVAGIQDTIKLTGGKSHGGRLPIQVLASAFSTPTAPTRCTALVTLTYSGPGGEVSNDMTRLVLTVTDANDM